MHIRFPLYLTQKFGLLFVLILIMNIFHSLSAYSQSVNSFYNREVHSILVEGSKKIEKDAILRKLTFKVGDTLTETAVRKSIKAVFNMGFFNEVDVRGSLKSDKTIVTVIVTERPVINEIVFEGNDDQSDDDLKDVIGTKLFNLLDIHKIQQDIKKIEKHYEEKGFYLARIDYEIEEAEPQPRRPKGVKLKFIIDEFDQVRVKRVFFLGNQVFSDGILKKIMETSEGSFWSFMSGAGSFKGDSFKNDMQRLQMYYLSEGYVRVKFDEPVITVSDDKRWVDITISVTEGEKYKIGDVSFEGDLLFTHNELFEQLSLKPGDWFSNLKLRADIQQLTEKYQDKGYAYANVVPRSDINDSKRIVDIAYQIDKGNLTYIGRINVQGNHKTKDKVVRRELEVYEGELFSGSGMRKSRANVERLGFFEPNSVKIVHNPSEEDPSVVNVDVSLKERQTGQLSLGAGYSSATKGFFTFQVAQNNLFGNGQELSAQAQISGPSKTYSLSFTEPYLFDSKWSSGFSLYRIFNSISNSHRYRSTGFDLRFGYPVFKYTRLYMTYKFDETIIRDIINEDELLQTRTRSELNEELGEGILSSVRLQLVRDLRNNRFEPTKGNFESLSVEYAGVGGDKKFVKAETDFRFYKELTEQGWVLRSRLKVGVLGQTQDRLIPVNERFFLGGPQSLKGYSDFTVSPFEGIRPTGGLYQAFTNIEFEHPLIREAGIKGVLFYDVGNVWVESPFAQGASRELLSDYGFGIRWFSPVGVLRFEFGYPIKKRSDPVVDKSPFFSFMIGPPF